MNCLPRSFFTGTHFLLASSSSSRSHKWGRCDRRNSPPVSSVTDFIFCCPVSSHVSIDTIHPSLLLYSFSSSHMWYNHQSFLPTSMKTLVPLNLIIKWQLNRMHTFCGFVRWFHVWRNDRCKWSALVYRGCGIYIRPRFAFPMLFWPYISSYKITRRRQLNHEIASTRTRDILTTACWVCIAPTH